VSATDLAITLAAVLEWQAPDGAVRLADGGVVRFNPGGGTVTFEGDHPVFGTLAGFDAFETAIGDSVEGGAFAFAPASGAAVSSWWRTDLENTALRFWVGEIDPADGVTLTDAELVADWLVDTARREQADGSDVLTIECMTRQEKLFEIRQGNVCSDAFHQTIWAGERGFENCTNSQQFFAWGTESPPGGGSGVGSNFSGGGSNFGGGGLGGLMLFSNQN
jgi:uncharacterized membrane protein YgcG